MSARTPDPDALAPSAVVDGLVSIVMPAHDTRPYVGEAIAAIQAQTHREWELIVVDDASSDGTPDVVAAIAARDPRVRLVRQSECRGPGPTRNTGIALARGRWLAFQDSDDLWDPDKLERQLAFMRARGAALSMHGYRMVDPELNPIGHPVRVPARVAYRALLKNTIVAMITVMVDRTQVGGLELPPLPQHEDLVLWYRTLRRGWVFEGVPEPLATYRIVRRSASRNKWRSALRMWRVYREQERLGVLDAAWCYAHYAINASWKYRRTRW